VVAPALLCWALTAGGGCTLGTGTVVFNELQVNDCSFTGESLAEVHPNFSLDLNYFAAERWGNALILRMQAGGTQPITSDGFLFSIADITALGLGPWSVGPGEDISAAVYLMGSCEAGRTGAELMGTLDVTLWEDRDGENGPENGDRIGATFTGTGASGDPPEYDVLVDVEVTFELTLRRTQNRFVGFDPISAY